MNLFEQARIELMKKGRKPTSLQVFDRAVAIRYRLDKEEAERERKSKREYRRKKRLS